MPKTETKRKQISTPGSRKKVKDYMTYKDGVQSSGNTNRAYVRKAGEAGAYLADKYADVRDMAIIKDPRTRAIVKEARDQDRQRKYESYSDYEKRLEKGKQAKENPTKKDKRLGYDKSYKDGGMALKEVDKKKNPGLAKLPTGVRNKMGYMKEGGMVLEIGLRPATKSEMKMAKEMKKPMKKAGGGMVRGTGAAITGKGFKGVF